jgi:hypothetical protein
MMAERPFRKLADELKEIRKEVREEHKAMTEKKKIKRSEFEEALQKLDYTDTFIQNSLKSDFENLFKDLGIEIEDDKKPQPGEVWEIAGKTCVIVPVHLKGMQAIYLPYVLSSMGLYLVDLKKRLKKYLAPDLETYYREKFEKEAKEQE